MKKTVLFVSLFIFIIMLSQFLVEAEDSYSYNSDIKALINKKECYECHPWMGTYSFIMNKEFDDARLVEPGNPDASMLIWRIEGKKQDGSNILKMPQGGPYYTEAEIAIFRAWISQGALEDISTGVEDTRSWMEIKLKFK
ncbi:hypothetical protein ACFL6H_07520 [Candidatus Latescibacterota bacterium]